MSPRVRYIELVAPAGEGKTVALEKLAAKCGCDCEVRDGKTFLRAVIKASKTDEQVQLLERETEPSGFIFIEGLDNWDLNQVKSHLCQVKYDCTVLYTG